MVQNRPVTLYNYFITDWRLFVITPQYKRNIKNIKSHSSRYRRCALFYFCYLSNNPKFTRRDILSICQHQGQYLHGKNFSKWPYVLACFWN